MAKIKAADLIKGLKHVEADRATFYSNQFPYNCGYIHEDGEQSYDCIGLVKSPINEPDILYRTSPVGYYVKPGQVIPDTTELGILNLCTDVSYSFGSLVPGEYLYMNGHGAWFVGEFTDPSGTVNVIECTPAFGGGVVTSYVDGSGRRWDHKGGYQVGRWEAHGKLSKYIEYDEPTPPEPSQKITVDGEWGVATTKLAQQVFHTIIDGEISNQDTDCRKYCLNCVPKGVPYGSWEWNDGDGYSPLIRMIQMKIGVDDCDGKFGYFTIRRMQKWLGVEEDGFCGPETVKAFQNWLNGQVK